MKNPTRNKSAIILAAGVGRRLTSWEGPKTLLTFDGQSLLERHLRFLADLGIENVEITAGHCADELRAEVDRLGPDCRVTLIENPNYQAGSLLSLACHDALLRSGQSILLMDGDVLYARAILQRLVQSNRPNALLVDRELEDDEEPVKICFVQEQIVDFHKVPKRPYEWAGESVGFFKFAPDIAYRLADRAKKLIAEGNSNYEYEEAIRSLILEMPGDFGAEDISGLPWTEIDFDHDVNRANSTIVPQLQRRHEGAQ
ncbi:MAG: phosphocholine cytidylyltransferase family protein [Pseudomonadota bacterium]